LSFINSISPEQILNGSGAIWRLGLISDIPGEVGHDTRFLGFPTSRELSLRDNKRSVMRQRTNITLTSESGQWNNRNSKVAATPKKIPPKTANGKARRKSVQGSNKGVRELYPSGDKEHPSSEEDSPHQDMRPLNRCSHFNSSCFAATPRSWPSVSLPML
jgi:hypothetical protein